MTSAWVTRVPRGHDRFWHVARMEWIKLRTLRSTWWTIGIGVAGAVAIGVAVLLPGTSFCLIGLLGLGLGAIIRHSPAAIGVLVGGVYVVAQVIGAVAHGVRAYMPILIVGNSTSTTRPLVLRWACRAVPAALAGVDRDRRALLVCHCGPGGRRVAAEPPGRVSGDIERPPEPTTGGCSQSCATCGPDRVLAGDR